MCAFHLRQSLPPLNSLQLIATSLEPISVSDTTYERMHLQILASLFIVAILSDSTRATADMIDDIVARLNGALSSSSLGDRRELKEKVPDKPQPNDHLFDSTTQEIIEEAGFGSRTHMFTSSDGYITELINLVNPLADRRQLKQPPVMLFHGALVDTSCWVAGSIRQHHPEVYPKNPSQLEPHTSSNRSLAFMLANNGFDVWLIATRGSNRRNIGHIHHEAQLLEDLLNGFKTAPNDQKARKLIDTLEFLDFSQDQLVEIEYPGQIDEVLRLTGSRKASVVTYSKATQIMFKILASDPVHSRRIYSHAAIAPILNNVGTSNFWKFWSKVAVSSANPIGNFVFSQLFASSWSRRLLASLNPHTWFHYIVTLATGPSPRYQTSTESSVIGHFLMSESFTEAKHYCQQIRAGKLQKYDYGKAGNRLVYHGSETPPEYSITNIKSKRWMMVTGLQDSLATLASSQKYFDSLPFKPDKWIKLDKGNHLDVVFALDNDVATNFPILEFMEKFKFKRQKYERAGRLATDFDNRLNQLEDQSDRVKALDFNPDREENRFPWSAS